MKRKIMGSVFFCSVMVLSYESVRAESPSQTSVTSSDDSFLEQIKNKVELSYYGYYRGASLTDLRNPHQPTSEGEIDLANPQSIENTITAGYRLTKDLSIGGIAHFYYFPMGSPVGTGQNVQMLDPCLMIKRNNWVNRGPLKVRGLFTLELPLFEGDALKTKNLSTALTPAIVANYAVPNVPLNLGLYSYFRFYLPGAGVTDDARLYKFVVAPNLTYQLTDRMSGTLWIDLVQVIKKRNTGAFGDISNELVDIEPGLNFDLTENISFNPVLNIYPANLTLAATSIQASLTARGF